MAEILNTGICNTSIIYVGDTTGSEFKKLVKPNYPYVRYFDEMGKIDLEPVGFGNFLLVEMVNNEVFTHGPEREILSQCQALICED